jgi:Isochorismate synthase
MRILENAFAFFMGAGITAESMPEKEWEETDQKMMTLRSVVNGINSSYELNKTGN